MVLKAQDLSGSVRAPTMYYSQPPDCTVQEIPLAAALPGAAL